MLIGTCVGSTAYLVYESNVWIMCCSPVTVNRRCCSPCNRQHQVPAHFPARSLVRVSPWAAAIYYLFMKLVNYTNGNKWNIDKIVLKSNVLQWKFLQPIYYPLLLKKLCASPPVSSFFSEKWGTFLNDNKYYWMILNSVKWCFVIWG